MTRIKRPLDPATTQKADDAFYEAHPEMVVNGRRKPIDNRNRAHVAEWKKLYIGFQDKKDPPPKKKPKPKSRKRGSPTELCPKASLIVTVTNAATGKPIKGASVSALGPESRSGDTDRKGQVTFSAINPGPYALSAEKSGFVPAKGDTEAQASTVNTAEIKMKPMASFELLVGGPYKKHGKSMPYGHVALRVVTQSRDLTYDYGRYGKVWGLGSSEGEGMLRVWTSFSKYIAGENATGRTTRGFRFEVSEADANRAIQSFERKVAGKKPVQNRGFMKQYRIQDYHALTRNCTTVSIDGAKQAARGPDRGLASPDLCGNSGDRTNLENLCPVETLRTPFCEYWSWYT